MAGVARLASVDRRASPFPDVLEVLSQATPRELYPDPASNERCWLIDIDTPSDVPLIDNCPKGVRPIDWEAAVIQLAGSIRAAGQKLTPAPTDKWKRPAIAAANWANAPILTIEFGRPIERIESAPVAAGAWSEILPPTTSLAYFTRDLADWPIASTGGKL